MAVKSVLFFIALLAFSCIIQSSSAESLTLKNLKTEETLNNQNLEKTDIIDEIDEYIKVFLEAAKISPMINYTDNCTDANRDLAKGLIDSINNAQSKGFNEDSYLQITESLGAAQPMIKICYNSSFEGYQIAAKHLADFKDFNSFAYKFGLNVAYGFFQWYELYFRFQKAIEDNNSTEITVASGILTYELFNFNSTLNGTFGLFENHNSKLMNSDIQDDKYQYLYDFFYHFLKGAQILESELISFCHNNYTSFKDNLDYAIDEIKKETEESIGNGVYAIADLFSIFHDLNFICIGGVNSALSAINGYIKIWNKPIQILYNVVFGYRDVYKHMKQVIDCSFQSDMVCTGLHSGILMYYILKHK